MPVHFHVSRDSVSGRPQWALYRGHGLLARGEAYDRLADLAMAVSLVQGAPGNRCQFRKYQSSTGQWWWTLLLPSLTEPLAHGGPCRTEEEADEAIRIVAETSCATAVEITDATLASFTSMVELLRTPLGDAAPGRGEHESGLGVPESCE